MRVAIVVSLIVSAIVFVFPNAYGEESRSNPSGTDAWKFSITPYIWAVGLNGDMTVKGNDTEVDDDFGDILDNLDIALEAHIEIWKGNWGFFFDGTYVDLETEGGSGPIDVDVSTELVLVDFGGLYRIGRWPLGEKKEAPMEGKGRSLMLELLLGGRYTDLEAELDPERLPKVKQSKDWIDLIVGGRLTFDFTEKWSLILRGDVGGFDIGSSSDFTANGSALVGWRISPKWDLLAGYRALYQDYEDGSGPNEFKYDITTHGPILGARYSW